MTSRSSSAAQSALVAHDDGVDHAVFIEGKLILAQHPQLPRPHYRTLLRIHLAGQEVHESGFARAVGPGQSVALARRKRGGNFVEQNFSAVAHGHITN